MDARSNLIVICSLITVIGRYMVYVVNKDTSRDGILCDIKIGVRNVYGLFRIRLCPVV